MTTTPATEPADLERFQRDGVAADAVNVARVRDEFNEWLRRRFDVDAGRANDILLAVNEALANVAEFAYLLTHDTGSVSLSTDYDRKTSALTVNIVDQGSWRDIEPDRKSRTRGRGIPLMHALADDVVIDRSDAGTTVRLRFDDVVSAREAYL